MSEDFAIKIENLKKQYRLGAIGGGTLTGDLQSWWARKRGKEDPNLKIGQDYSNSGERFLALDGINITIKKGEAVGIIGANGAGKSTLLKILSRVTAPTEGDIWINGRISSMLEVGTGFHPEMTGRENIYMNGAILGMTRKEVDAKIESIIDFSECRQFIDTPVKRYSSGMYVKLAFAVASHLDAEIMVMDEVLAVGDMKFQKKCLGKMSDAAHSEKKTVLYVSHNMATIRNLCDRCIVLNHGKLIFDGDVEDAINVYMDYDKGNLITFYDFQFMKREHPQFGQKVKMISVEFLEKNISRYNDSDDIKLRIKWQSLVKNVKFRISISIKYFDGTPAGMAESIQDICTDNISERNTIVVLRMKNHVAGLYKLYVCFYELTDLSAFVEIDESLPMFVEILETPKIGRCIWQREYWGHIKPEILHIE